MASPSSLQRSIGPLTLFRMARDTWNITYQVGLGWGINSDQLDSSPTPVIESLIPVIESLIPVIESLKPVTESPTPVIESLTPVLESLIPVIESLTTVNNNNGRNGSFFYVAGYLIEERRRWPVITASPQGQCSK